MEDLLIQSIQSGSIALRERLISWRRHLHQHPELSEQEHGTAAWIRDQLEEIGLVDIHSLAGTGVVAILHGKESGPACIALRADTDALPIEEANEVPYRSINPGVMHACGHDAHTASLLGTAALLYSIREQWKGTVKFIFQPSEEKYPGGAIRMIGEGVLEDPRPAHVFGQHVLPSLESGKAGFRPGPFMASTDEVHITVHGKGGHGATPELGVDPLSIAAQILVALQQVVSRKAPPTTPTVLTFGRFIANGQTNIIPDQASMHGILRTFDEEWRYRARDIIRNMAEGMADSMGASCEVFIDPGYPALVNDPDITTKASAWAAEYLGSSMVEPLPQRMTAEDFSYYAIERPSCFYRLGVRNEEKGILSNLHTPNFDIDEESLVTGAGLMAWIAVNSLRDLSL